MKSNRGITALAAILIVVGILVLGGGAYYAFQKYRVPTISPGVVQNQTPTGWKTYTDSQRGYTISYPADAKFSINNDYVKSCAQIDTKEFGVVYVGGCGEPTGLGTDMVFAKDSMTISGKQYSTSGRRESDNSYSFLSFNYTPDDNILVIYGVDHSDKTNPNNWKNLGPLTDTEYQAALNSAKEIVSTIKPIQ